MNFEMIIPNKHIFKQLFDYEEFKNSRRDVTAGLKLEGYNFIIYCRFVESWYKGEDSGARYVDEWSEDIPIEIYDLTSILDNVMIDGITVKEFIDTKCNIYKLYLFLDDLPVVNELRTYSWK